MDGGEDFSKLTSRRLIHLSQPVTPTPSLLLVLLPASLFSIKCQDWPFYNHICDLGSGIQMQSMSIRITGLLIERREMVWAIFPIFILTLKYCTHIYAVPKLWSVYSCLQVAGALLLVTGASHCWNRLRTGLFIIFERTFNACVVSIYPKIQDMVVSDDCDPITWTAVFI